MVKMSEENTNLTSKIQQGLSILASKPDYDKTEEVLNDFLEYGIFLNSNKAEDLPNTIILDFTTANKDAAIKALPAISNYLNTLALTKLSYSYEDHDEQEYVLSQICRSRSGLEFFVEYFEARIKEVPNVFDDWYSITSGIPSFDEHLRYKIKQHPIITKVRIPNGLPESHWWFLHPDEW